MSCHACAGGIEPPLENQMCSAALIVQSGHVLAMLAALDSLAGSLMVVPWPRWQLSTTQQGPSCAGCSLRLMQSGARVHAWLTLLKQLALGCSGYIQRLSFEPRADCAEVAGPVLTAPVLQAATPSWALCSRLTAPSRTL